MRIPTESRSVVFTPHAEQLMTAREAPGALERAVAMLPASLECCPHCLHELFALKRSLETPSAIPSAAAKARLRTAVAQTVERAQARAGWSWWERPLAIGFATAAVALAAFATASLAASPGAAPHGWVASNQP